VGSENCKKEMNYIFQQHLPNHPIDELLLEARWRPQDMDAVTATIQWAAQHHVPVIVFGPVDEYDAPLPRLLAYSIAWNEPDMPSRHRVTSRAEVDGEMQNMAATNWHVPYVSLYQTICNGDNCLEYADSAHEVPMMNDEDHLNESGSGLVVRRLVERGELR
jgi:hypothetical protein